MVTFFLIFQHPHNNISHHHSQNQYIVSFSNISTLNTFSNDKLKRDERKTYICHLSISEQQLSLPISAPAPQPIFRKFVQII